MSVIDVDHRLVTLRIGIVGCGSVARRSHLPGFRAAGADVTVFASRSPRSARQAAQQWGRGQVVDDWRYVIDRSDVDAIDVCTPNASHAEIAIAAASAGKHILVEKPMACTVEEADDMVSAAVRAGVVLMPAHSVRFMAPFVTMRDAVARGQIGRVRSFRCAWGHGGPQEWAPDATWFRDRSISGGGALIDLGVHALDLVRSILRDEVVTVSALMSPCGESTEESEDVEEVAQLIVRFSDGALGSIQASWAVASGTDHQLTIQGSLGILHLDDRTPPVIVRAKGGGSVRLPVRERCPSIFDAFVEAVERQQTPQVTAADGRAAVAFITAAYRSAQSGRAEHIDPAGAASGG
jgi:UDP-N-acetylglucosamine 3-dehydrogenase